jgi:hypothetical protein
MNKDSIFIELLKKHTNIDSDFIDTFFKKFKIGGELDFDLKDTSVSKYLNINLSTLRKRLTNAFSKNNNYIKNVDYIRIKLNNDKNISYMINYQCFEKLAMTGDSSKCETIRMYFIKLREFMTNNQHLIFQALENKTELNKFTGLDCIYFFAVSKSKKIFKIGRTINIIQRLRNYNVGRIKEVELKYLAVVTNSLLIENCIKLKLENNQLFDNKEIYKISAEQLKKIVTNCYCKYVNKEQNEQLYKELSDILGMYSYIKNKKQIEPYIIINK